MDKRVLTGLGILALVILASGGAFYYGTSVGEAQASQARQSLFRQGMRGQGGQFQGGFAAGPPDQADGARMGGGTLGTVEAIEDNILVVNTQEGVLQVRVTDTTLIEKYTSVGVDQIEIGEQVMVSGSRNDDDSVTARSIRTLQQRQLQQSE
jgi:hypothetical protein